MAKRKKRAGGGEDSGGGGRVKVYLHAVTNDEAALLTGNGNTSPLEEVKNQSCASEVQFHQNQSVMDMKIIIICGNPQQIQKAVSLINQKTGSKETISDQAQTYWLQWVEAAYPDLDSRAYFLPPVYFNRVPMTLGSVSGQDVLILNTEHGQSSRSNQPTLHEGVGGSSEQELPGQACESIQPSLPDDEYQDTKPILPGQTSQCIQPTPAEESCISNHRAAAGHFSQVSQLAPEHKAGCSNHMAPQEQAGNYILAASRRQADECIQLTLPGEVSHNNETSHKHNGQFIQTPPAQVLQTRAHFQSGPPVHTSQYEQTTPNVQDGQHLQRTPTGRTCQYIHSPPGQDSQGNQSYPSRQTGQFSQTMTSGQYVHDIQETTFGRASQYKPTLPGQGEYNNLPTAQAYQYSQTTPHGQAGQYMHPTPRGEAYQYSQTTPHGQAGQYMHPTPRGEAYQYSQTTPHGQAGLYMHPTPRGEAYQYSQTTPHGQAGQYMHPTPRGEAYQYSQTTPHGQAGQYMHPTPRGEAYQYSQTTPHGQAGLYMHPTPRGEAYQYSQTTPHGQAGQYMHPTPRGEAYQYSQTTPHGQAGLYMHPTPRGEAYQYSQTTPHGQAGQYMHPTPRGEAYQYSQTTPHGQAGQYMHPTPLGEAYQYSQTIQCGLTSQYMPTAPPGQADQDILSPCGLTGDYIQTKARGQAGECIFPTPHQQTSQRIELEAASSDVVQPSVHRPAKVLDSDVRDDAAKQRVLVCLQEFSERNKEVLVGMSQLTFGHYLGEPVYAAATAQLPLPQNIPETSSKTTQGSYDVLLIHRHYGFVVCEVRAFGDNTQILNMSQQDIDNNIRQKLRDAVSQLDKAEAMLSHLVSDIAPGLRITKTIAFPNLTTRQVQQAICKDITLTEDLCRCLGTSDPADIAGLCLCCDQLSDPKTPCDVTSHVLRELGHWWQRRVAVAGPDSHMTDVVYKMLVARFCGPATTVSVPCTCPPRVSVKTLGQAVWWTGECYTAVITLFPEQVHLLHTAPPTLFVTGPPGTGKTVVLLLMAIQWLRCGHHVYVVSTWWGSRAASSMLYHLLLQTVKKQLAPEVLASQLHLLRVNLDGDENVEKAVNDLSQAASGGSLYVLIDEMGHEDSSAMYAPKMKYIQTFCEKLLAQVPRLHLWAASCYHKNCPPGWQVEYLTRPLRSPPAVVREIKKDTVITKGISIKKYSERGMPDHTDGPPVRRVYHGGHSHSGRLPDDCVTCGREVGSFLHSLRVGVTENNDLTTVNTVTSTTGGTTPCLQWRDVLVLNWCSLSVHSGVGKGLQEAGIPVQVMKDEDIEDVATARSDLVWVAEGHRVRGLERKVVVCVQNDARSLFDHLSLNVRKSEASKLNARFRSDSFHSISRCTSQLVIVECPPAT